MLAIQRTSFALLTFILISTTAVLQSCKVQFVPEYDAAIAEHIELTAKKVDKFYLLMLETSDTSNGGRAYEKFAEGYVDIEVELKSLLHKNELRPLNELSIENCELILESWRESKDFHKEMDSISDEMISNFQEQMEDMFFALLKTEKANQMAETN